MSAFAEKINTYSPLSKEAENDFVSKLKTKSFKKGDIINNENVICKQLYFIETGLVKQYYYHNDRLFILRFFAENSIFTVLDSFINQTPADFQTIALEDTTLTYIDYAEVQELAQKHHCFETFLRVVFSHAALYNINRIKEMFNSDAAQLYESFIKNNKHLLQRISLGDIASYLGMSQVTLSRIRSRK